MTVQAAPPPCFSTRDSSASSYTSKSRQPRRVIVPASNSSVLYCAVWMVIANRHRVVKRTIQVLILSRRGPGRIRAEKPRRKSFEGQQFAGIHAHHFVIDGSVNRAEPVPCTGRDDHHVAGAYCAAHAIFEPGPSHAGPGKLLHRRAIRR